MSIPGPDDEPDQEVRRAAERYVAAVHEQCQKAIAKLYGELPDWLPEPAKERLERAILNLQAAGQTDEQICAGVASAREERLSVPATVLDVTTYFQAMSDLAHAQWALSLDEAGAIKELGGSDAASGRRIRQQRRSYSEVGNARKRELAAQRQQNWLQIGRPLRKGHPDASDSWLADRIAERSKDKASTIRAALSKLGLSKK